MYFLIYPPECFIVHKFCCVYAQNKSIYSIFHQKSIEFTIYSYFCTFAQKTLCCKLFNPLRKGAKINTSKGTQKQLENNRSIFKGEQAYDNQRTETRNH